MITPVARLDDLILVPRMQTLSMADTAEKDFEVLEMRRRLRSTGIWASREFGLLIKPVARLDHLT